MLYTGTFEAYQGLDLLFEAAVRLQASHPAARVLIVGGEPDQVAAAQARAGRIGARHVVFTGQQPAREIPAFVAAAAVLASPRIRGTNTPLKIYSYLRSGMPIVATEPADPHPGAVAGGGPSGRRPSRTPSPPPWPALLDDPPAGRALADAARRLSDEKLQP